MSCLLTQWFDLDCNDSIGGIEELYVLENTSIDTITEVSGVVTAISTVGSKKFNRYRLKDEVGSMQSPVNHNQQNGTTFFEHTIVGALNKLSSTKRNEFKILMTANSTFIVKDMNGLYWLCGKTRGMYPSAGDFGTGTAAGDANGMSFTMIAREKEPPIAVNSALITDTLINGL